jgi:hypothetical protein
MAQTRLQRATVSDVALIDLLKGWTPAETLPPDDRIVLIARTSPVGSQLLLRDMGYYDHIEEAWLTLSNRFTPLLVRTPKSTSCATRFWKTQDL